MTTLSKPRVAVRDDVTVGGVRLLRLITTEHDGFTVLTAIHSRDHDFAQGGVRFVEAGGADEVARLALGMTLKARAANVPIDGLKGLVICPRLRSLSRQDKSDMLSEHIEAIRDVERDFVYGPDMNCPEAVLDLVAEAGLVAHVTGLSRAHGGLDIDRMGLTASGVRAAVDAVVSTWKASEVVSTVQGFGAVGAWFARLSVRRGEAVAAVSNVDGALIGRRGLDAERLFELWCDSGDAALSTFAAACGDAARLDPSPEALFTIPTEVFVPAARTSALVMADELDAIRREENPSAQDVAIFYEAAHPKVVAEAANHPLSHAAEAWLEARGVVILPDVLINCAGMIGCYLEIVHRKELLSDPDAFDRIYAQAEQSAHDAILDSISSVLEGRHNAAEARAVATARPAS